MNALVNRNHLTRLTNLIDLPLREADGAQFVRIVEELGEQIEELEAYGMTYDLCTANIREMFERVTLPVDKDSASEFLTEMDKGDSWRNVRALATGEGPQGAAFRYALFEFVSLFCRPAGLSSRWATDLVRRWRHGDGHPCLDSCLDALECSMQDAERRAILQEYATKGAQMVRSDDELMIDSSPPCHLRVVK